MFARVSTLAFLAAAASILRPASAQHPSAPEIELSVGGSVVHGGTWDRSWEPGPAVGLGVAANYGPGIFRLGLRGHSNEGATEELPDFVTVHADAGWGPVLRLPAGARLIPAVHVGAVAFLFDDADVDEPLRNESEVSAGAGVRLDVPLWRWVRGWAGVDAARVFTRPYEDVLFVEGGLGIALPAPAWLRRVGR